MPTLCPPYTTATPRPGPICFGNLVQKTSCKAKARVEATPGWPRQDEAAVFFWNSSQRMISEAKSLLKTNFFKQSSFGHISAP